MIRKASDRPGFLVQEKYNGKIRTKRTVTMEQARNAQKRLLLGEEPQDIEPRSNRSSRQARPRRPSRRRARPTAPMITAPEVIEQMMKELTGPELIGQAVKFFSEALQMFEQRLADVEEAP